MDQRMRILIPKIVSLLFILCIPFFIFITPSKAHSIDSGYSEVTIESKKVNFNLTLPESSLLVFDTDKNNVLTLEELNNQRTEIESYFKTHLKLENKSKLLECSLHSISKTDNLGIPSIEFNLQFTSVSSVESLSITYNLLFDDYDPQHVNFLIITKEDDIDQTIFDTGHRFYHYVPMNNTTMASSAWQYFLLGIKHILTGYDHLLFLLSLIIVAIRLKDIIKIVTAFTLAHSITLFLTATGHISVNSRWIETGIALTIAYVAIENPFIKSVRMRWVITFLFGLIHGMGFAGAISEIGLPREYLISSLLSFNVGVETGQLGIVLAILPFLLKLQKFTWYRKMLIGVSIIVFLIAVYWALQRMGIIL
ncbi:Hydrogenase/urease accessory protein HupE [Paenibacillus sp. yr247]|uniref:HupE/UreJ family protein n=1 Tax=Paenibacillus sp. yr247 TaxID=1761880 RepID=UPI000880C9EB|nr:HupE/UreJ family protein [Paenibacillus sp. yr247]SDO99123.1 Hydrogenase/urease accessory protein HupE [Paenibacillus sp. yr247]